MQKSIFTKDFVEALGYASILSEKSQTTTINADALFFGVYQFLKNQENGPLIRQFL